MPDEEKEMPDLSGLVDHISAFQEEHGTIDPVELLGRDDEPITVAEVKMQQALPLRNSTVGAFVAVRPIDDKKTHLGIYLGELFTTPMVAHSSKSQTLFVNCRTNPAMFVPDLNKVVWGSGSWWGEIKNEEDLRQISDKDIENVWYVKALRATMEQGEVEEEAEDALPSD